MKEIRAYIRRYVVNEVVQKLYDAGAPGVLIIEIHPVGYGYDANPFERYRAGLVERYRHLTIVKLEIVCADVQLERLVGVIEAHCCTGSGGDGMIFVSEVIEAVRICDGARREAALIGCRPRTEAGATHATTAA